MARILVVDGDTASVQMLVQALHEHRHLETRVASSAADALRAAVEFQPAIVFLDIELPDRGSYELATHLHRHARQMKLIALTSKGEHPARERARASGFERYIMKPITEAAVQEVLDTLT